MAFYYANAQRQPTGPWIGGPMVVRGCVLAVVAPETRVPPADF